MKTLQIIINMEYSTTSTVQYSRTTKRICNGTPTIWKKQGYTRRFTSGLLQFFTLRQS